MTNPTTLTAIVDEVNDSRLFNEPLTASRRATLGRVLIERQGLPGSYCGLFAPMDGEIADGYRFFTGERINTNAGCRHILGEEALRALVLLEPSSRAGQAAIGRAGEAMSRRLHTSETEHGGGLRVRGTFCCNRCSVALWRVFGVGAIDDAADRLTHGLRWLKAKRDGAGAWRGMPFHYTLSALLDTDNEIGIKELRYARPAIERRLDRAPAKPKDPYAARRKRLLELAAARN